MLPQGSLDLQTKTLGMEQASFVSSQNLRWFLCLMGASVIPQWLPWRPKWQHLLRCEGPRRRRRRWARWGRGRGGWWRWSCQGRAAPPSNLRCQLGLSEDCTFCLENRFNFMLSSIHAFTYKESPESCKTGGLTWSKPAIEIQMQIDLNEVNHWTQKNGYNLVEKERIERRKICSE